ncbi:FUSC family protein [Gryllotalpicola ginsengisoli]|uniref:FUSC family protein n=1 Tax=Gryllotalpicola ginsengisoli TaxID=444608 RepID=UPI0003B79AD0|nr:FUSC family protein [Gryllotalpicola ginsengisoli]
MASDPGLNRLKSGLAAAGNVAATMGVEYAVATLIGAGSQGTVVFLLLGSVVAMMGTNALVDHRVAENARTAAWFPVAVGVGLTAGTMLSPYHLIALAGFVVVMFLAVWVRRFGLPYFFYGFLLWMGYFFADFLGVTAAALPGMLLAVVVATAVVLLLCCTVFRPHPRRTLARVFRSMQARTRALARALAELARAEPGSSAQRRASQDVFDARARVNDASLMSDGWAAHARALPEGWTASALRSRLLELQLGLDRLTIGTRELAAAGPEASVRARAAAVLEAFADGNRERARTLAEALAEETGEAPRRVREAVTNLERGIRVLTSVPNRPVLAKTMQENEAEFVPAAELVLGQLPGTPSVASDVDPRGGVWNPLRRLRFSTRQAVQVAVAGALSIVVGSLINGQRYYWAVIAAFVSFAGTGTRFDTTRKSVLRVVGTLAGLVAGVVTGHWTSGHTLAALAVIVACMFCGNYLMRVSYGYFIFFLTIMLSELYAILGQFSDQLLLLRLAETAAGAAVGIGVALVVTPVSTRDAIDQTLRATVDAVADVLDAVRRRIADPDEQRAAELDAVVVAADNQLRRLVLVAGPLTHYQFWENRPRAIRRQLTVAASAVAGARNLAVLAREQTEPDPELAAELGKVSAYAHQLASRTEPLPVGAARTEPAADVIDTRALPVAVGRAGEAYRALARLQALLEELL